VVAELQTVAGVLDVSLVHELIEHGPSEKLGCDPDELRRATEAPQNGLGASAPDDAIDSNLLRLTAFQDEQRALAQARFVERSGESLEARKSATKALDGALSEGLREHQVTPIEKRFNRRRS
jgi:hypothetical protein